MHCTLLSFVLRSQSGHIVKCDDSFCDGTFRLPDDSLSFFALQSLISRTIEQCPVKNILVVGFYMYVSYEKD